MGTMETEPYTEPRSCHKPTGARKINPKPKNTVNKKREGKKREKSKAIWKPAKHQTEVAQSSGGLLES